MELNNINVTTLIALFGWPLVACWLYSTRPIAQATLWTILGGYLLLPANAFIKIQMIPEINKDSIPVLVALLACLIKTRRFVIFGAGFGLAELLILASLITPFISAISNGDQVSLGGKILPAVGAYDGGSAALSEFVTLIPFFLGRQLLRSPGDTEKILKTLVIAGLIYSLPMLFEMRMSPQLNYWIYGYLPHEEFFLQQSRGGGFFRPVVFLGHGLALAFFAMTTVVASAALWRTRIRIAGLPPAGITGYLGFVLFLGKSFAAIIYAGVLTVLVACTSPRLQMRMATVLVAIALAYPMLRMADLVPTTSVLGAVERINHERADFLQVRFFNERQLLDHAMQRFWFGWGRYGRGRVYDDNGEDMSITDGYWVITMGEVGFVGYLAVFGLLALTVFRAASALKFTRNMDHRIIFSALTLIVAIKVFDLVPNSELTSWYLLLTGAVLGRAETLQLLARQERAKAKLYSSAIKFKAVPRPAGD